MRNLRHFASFAFTLAALPVACCATIAGGVAGAAGAAVAGLLFASSRVTRPDMRPTITEPDPQEIAARYRDQIAARRQMS